MTRSVEFWAQVCRLTCIGGSEAGTCECRGPRDCIARADVNFATKRRQAMVRLARVCGVANREFLDLIKSMEP